jgi:hypothetical protein
MPLIISSTLSLFRPAHASGGVTSFCTQLVLGLNDTTQCTGAVAIRLVENVTVLDN